LTENGVFIVMEETFSLFSLSELAKRTIEVNSEVFLNKTFYCVKIHLQPNFHGGERSNIDSANFAARQIVNGLASINRVSNRAFWNKYFDGGIRYTSFCYNNSKCPTLCVNLLVFSSDVEVHKMESQFRHRLRKIAPSEIEILKIGQYHETSIEELIEVFFSRICTDKELEGVRDWERLKNQKLVVFGTLYTNRK
jgi:hypothetical protein